MSLVERARDARQHQFLDHFGWVLALVLVTIAGQSLVDTRESFAGATLTHALSGAALVLAVRACGLQRRWRRAADVLVVATVLGNLLYLLLGDGGAPDPGRSIGINPGLLWVVAASLVPVVVARRLLQHRVVTVATMLGAVAAYLQIAVAYAFISQSIDALTHTHFFGDPVSTTVYMYVSLETISTLGFGDFTPVTDLGRLALMSEAVVGQVYLVTFVALIVSRFAARPDRWRGADPDEQAASAAVDPER
ncbi:MAG: potassium channel family protein [Terracoccus sp.]